MRRSAHGVRDLVRSRSSCTATSVTGRTSEARCGVAAPDAFGWIGGTPCTAARYSACSLERIALAGLKPRVVRCGPCLSGQSLTCSQLDQQHAQFARAPPDEVAASAISPPSHYYLGPATLELLGLDPATKHCLRVTASKIASFRQAYSAALDPDLLSVEDRVSCFGVVYKAVVTSEVDGRPIGALATNAKVMMDAVARQIGAEIGHPALVPDVSSGAIGVPGRSATRWNCSTSTGADSCAVRRLACPSRRQATHFFPAGRLRISATSGTAQSDPAKRV